MKDRVKSILAKTSPHADAVLLSNSVDPHIDQSFFYVFDVPSGLFEGAVALGFPDGRLHVITNPLEEESARQAAKHDPAVELHIAKSRDERDEQLKELLHGSSAVGLNYHELTHEDYLGLEKALPSAKFSDASAAILRTRRVKDAQEVERLERAGEIGSKVGREIPGMLKEGMTELELAAMMEARMMAHGSSGASFATIVGFGAHSAEPHYSPGETKLKSGMSIVTDFGALYRRYASDITRSFRFGSNDPELKRVHETVEAAQQAALAIIRPGVPAKDVHLAAQEVIDRSPWKGRFTHGLGHSIGLAVHDGFSMNHRVDDPLDEGMTITVEPGIYLPGRGGVRIEDDIVVTKDGYRFLTTAPRGYLEVPA